MFNSLSGDSGGIANQLFQFAAAQTSAGQSIDWAQLAQQWIAQNSAQQQQQNVAINSSDDVVAPPPPNISGFQNNGKRSNKNYTSFEEKGEADMDMEDMDNEEVPPAPPMLGYAASSGGNAQNAQWFAAQTGCLDPMSTWNTWTNSSSGAVKSNPTAHIPSLMKISVPNPNVSSKSEDENSTSMATLDAAKRKVLPAWIREGLEKMEREKQKQLEREQGVKKHDNPTLNLGLHNDQTVKSKFQASDHDEESSDNEQVVGKDDRFSRPSSSQLRKFHDIKNASTKEDDADDDAAELSTRDDIREPSDNFAADFGKSYEQKLADLMIAVRRTLTELLLEVTNEEIANVAQETLKSRKLKASSAQVVRKSALSSITNKLGLAAYSSSGESDSDNSGASDNDDDNGHHRADSANTASEDSEEEIRSKLRLRRRAFAKVSDEIEERVAANAAREEQKLKYYKQKEQQQLKQQLSDNDDESGDSDGGEKQQHRSTKNASALENTGLGKNYARDFGETTTDSKLQSSNGKRSRERGGGRRGERTTRFSDNKDTNNISTVTASYITQLAAGGTTSTASTAASTTTPTIVTIPQYPITAGSAVQLPDSMTKLQNLYPPTSATAAGINTMLNAADAALEKAAKAKTSSTKKSSKSSSRRHYDDNDRRRRRRHRRDSSRRHTSDESDTSTNSKDSSDTSNTSHSSRHSKYSRTSSNSYSRHHNKQSGGSSTSRYDDYKRYHSSHDSSRYDERYPRSSSSSKSSKYATDRGASTSSKRRDRSSSRDRHRNRDRSRSRSRSTYSSSSTRRHKH